MSDINNELQTVYETLPKMTGSRCNEFCESGKCLYECCTITGCSAKERKNINKYIRDNRLGLRFIKEQHGPGYVLPYGKISDPKCQYIGQNGCMIYEVRPAICRLFGAVKQMPCSYQKSLAKHAEYPLEAMMNIGMMTKEQYDEGIKRGGLKLFNQILNKDKEKTMFKKIAKHVREFIKDFIDFMLGRCDCGGRFIDYGYRRRSCDKCYKKEGAEFDI